MGENLGLNNHHHQQAVNYIRFSRYKRVQSLKGVQQCFKDLEDSKLYDDTYTIDEVKEMLNELMKSVTNEMDMELLNSSHTSTLLLTQLLTQAEKWHLKLNCDVSDLENRELLEQIAEFEEKELSIAGTADKSLKLNPINQTGGAELLNNEIERLKAENRNLLNVVKKKEEAVSDSDKLNKSLVAQINDAKSKDSSVVQNLEKQVANLQIALQSKNEGSVVMIGDGQNKDLLSDLTSTKHELLRTRKELETASEDLNLKFQQTTAYKNLKDMLTKKNDQIKTLRKSLQKYEGDK